MAQPSLLLAMMLDDLSDEIWVGGEITWKYTDCKYHFHILLDLTFDSRAFQLTGLVYCVGISPFWLESFVNGATGAIFSNKGFRNRHLADFLFISAKSGCLLPSECLCSRGWEKKHRTFLQQCPSMWCWAWNDESKLPGKQVAVNFDQLYPWNQPQLPKILVHYVFQVGLICWKFFSTQTWMMRNGSENSGEAKEPGWWDSAISPS